MSLHLNNNTGKKAFSSAVFLYLTLRNVMDCMVDFIAADYNQGMWRSYSEQKVSNFENSIFKMAFDEMIAGLNHGLPWSRRVS